LLEAAGVEYLINPIGRKLKEDELAEMISDFDVVLAGTEPITDKVMGHASRLKLISRVGIGLDSVDLLAAKRRGIRVSNTPDAPAPAMAELTIGLMLSLLRHVHVANAELHRGEWQCHFGRRITEVTIGIIGVGRIGRRVLTRLSSFGNRACWSTTSIPTPNWFQNSSRNEWARRRFTAMPMLSACMFR